MTIRERNVFQIRSRESILKCNIKIKLLKYIDMTSKLFKMSKNQQIQLKSK